MVKRHIDRIPTPDRATFYRDYVSTRTPVILTDLFAGQPIAEISTLSEATAAIGSSLLNVQPEYAHAIKNPADAEIVTMTLSDYWRHVTENPTSKLLCTEYEIPAKLMAKFDLPHICRSPFPASAEYLGIPNRWGDHDLLSNIFIANAGNAAHLHFDGDHREVFLHQIFGRKQVILFQPEEGAFLRPFQFGMPFSGYFLEEMPMEAVEEIVDIANGYVATLNPGETLYMPKLIWHYLKYIDHGMSINIRFGRDRAGRFLCNDNFHRDYYIQNFSSCFSGIDGDTEFLRASLDEICALYGRLDGEIDVRVLQVRGLFKDLCRRHLPQVDVDSYDVAHPDSHELPIILKDLENSFRYEKPEILLRSLPQGRVTPAQHRQLSVSANRCGYDDSFFNHLLCNLTGKSAVNDLNKAEAAQVLSYLRSPGATLRDMPPAGW